MAHACAAKGDNAFHAIDWRSENLLCRDADCCDATLADECVSGCVTLGPVAHVMHNAINFDRQLRSCAIEIDDEGADWMLAPKF